MLLRGVGVVPDQLDQIGGARVLGLAARRAVPRHLLCRVGTFAHSRGGGIFCNDDDEHPTILPVPSLGGGSDFGADSRPGESTGKEFPALP